MSFIRSELYANHKTVVPKKKSDILFADNSGNVHMTFQEFRRKPVIKRRTDDVRLYEQVNILGKRKLVEAFGEEIYNDKDRYGQDIPDDFFKTNIGHGVK